MSKKTWIVCTQCRQTVLLNDIGLCLHCQHVYDRHNQPDSWANRNKCILCRKEMQSGKCSVCEPDLLSKGCSADDAYLAKSIHQRQKQEMEQEKK